MNARSKFGGLCCLVVRSPYYDLIFEGFEPFDVQEACILKKDFEAGWLLRCAVVYLLPNEVYGYIPPSRMV